MRGNTLSALFKRARLLPPACLLALALAPAARADAIVMSNFDTGTEGWSGVSIDASDMVTGTHPVNWNSSGGDPGGHIWRGDPQGGTTFYFAAPSKFLGDVSAAYGGTLTYEVRHSGGVFYNAADVYLVGGASPLTLVFDSPAQPSSLWTPFTIPLSEGQWRVGSLSGAFATQQQIMEVLSALTALRIRGEFLNATNETCRLDNVSLNAPEPEPTPEAASIALMGTGLMGCAFVARRCRREAKRRRRSRDCRHAYVEPAGLSI